MATNFGFRELQLTDGRTRPTNRESEKKDRHIFKYSPTLIFLPNLLKCVPLGILFKVMLDIGILTKTVNFKIIAQFYKTKVSKLSNHCQSWSLNLKL